MKKYFDGRSTLGGLSLAALLFAAGTSTLLADVPTMSAHIVGAEQDMVTYEPDLGQFHVGEGGMYELNAPVAYEDIWGGDANWMIQELKYDTDPIVYNNILLQNNSGVSQSYVVTINLPTTWSAPNLIRGSIDTSIIGTDSLISAPLNGSIYSALIDGVTVRTLQDDPFSLGTSQSATSNSAQFGYDVNGIAVGSSIGIELQFMLSPGDTAAILSDFEVTVVPEPTTLALVGLGALGLIMVRRRR